MKNLLIEVKNLKKYFDLKNKSKLHAVDDLSFNIYKGEVLGLVGESGCGKSTTGRTLLRLIPATSGEIIYNGENTLDYNAHQVNNMRKKMQIIFQDPNSCLNPRKTVKQIIAEPLLVQKVLSKEEINNKVYNLMLDTGIPHKLSGKYPHELDGGTRQRAGIARALALEPEFIVCDEPISALDVSIQAQILNLISDLKEQKDLTYLFITHDLSVVKHISNRIMVMYLGKLVEIAETDELFTNPKHPYTNALLSAIPIPKINKSKDRIILEGDVPSPIDPGSGCRFANRCWLAEDICFKETPELGEYSKDHYVSCHMVKSNMK